MKPSLNDLFKNHKQNETFCQKELTHLGLERAKESKSPWVFKKDRKHNNFPLKKNTSKHVYVRYKISSAGPLNLTSATLLAMHSHYPAIKVRKIILQLYNNQTNNLLFGPFIIYFTLGLCMHLFQYPIFMHLAIHCLLTSSLAAQS